MAPSSTSSEAEELSESSCVVLGLYHLVIANPQTSVILCSVSDNGACTLPQVAPVGAAREFYWESNEEELLGQIREELGLECRVLRPLWYNSADDDFQEAVLELEVSDWDFCMPKDYKWVHREDNCVPWYGFCPEISFTELLDMVFDLGRLMEQPPWRRRNWVNDTLEWVESALQDKKFYVKTPPRAVSNTDDTFVVKYSVNDGSGAHDGWNDVYVKATLPHITEPETTLAIAGFAHGMVPKVIAVNRERNVFVQEGVGQVSNDDFQPMAFVQTLAKLQTKARKHVDKLVATGVEVLDAKWLQENIERLAFHPVLDELEHEGGSFFPERLRECVDHIKDVCSELDAYGIGNSLVHGDLHIDNIGLGQGDNVYSVIDWGSCVISHPFQDFDTACRRISKLRNRKREALELAYFKAWASLGRIEELRRCARLSGVLFWGIDLHRCLCSVDTVAEDDREERVEEVEKSINCLLLALDEVCSTYSDVSS